MGSLSKKITQVGLTAGLGIELAFAAVSFFYNDVWFLPVFGLIIPVLGYFADDIRILIIARKLIRDEKAIDGIVRTINSKKLQDDIMKYKANARSDLIDLIKRLRDGVVQLDNRQLDRFIQMTFSTNTHYTGVDVSLPSTFMYTNKKYLESHQTSLDENKAEKRGWRIIIQSREALERDSAEEGYRMFWQWHKDNNVELLYIEPQDAQKIIEEFDINPVDCGWGIGLWSGEYAVMFGTRWGFGGKTRIWIFDDTKTEEFKSIVRTCNKMKSNAKPIELDMSEIKSKVASE